MTNRMVRSTKNEFVEVLEVAYGLNYMNVKNIALMLLLTLVILILFVLPWSEKEYVRAIAVSPDGKFVVTGSSKGLMALWRTSDNASVWKLSNTNHSIETVRVSADGNKVCAATEDGLIIIADAQRGRISEKRQFKGTIADILCNDEGSYVIAAGMINLPKQPLSTLVKCDLRDNADDHVFRTSLVVQHLQNGTRNGQFFSAARDGSLIEWQDTRIQNEMRLTLSTDVLMFLELNSVSEFAVGADTSGIPTCWSMRTGEPIWTDPTHGSEVSACAISANGRYCAFGFGNGEVQAWDVASGRSIGFLTKIGRPVAAMVFISEEDVIIASGSSRHLGPTLAKWRISTGALTYFDEGK